MNNFFGYNNDIGSTILQQNYAESTAMNNGLGGQVGGGLSFSNLMQSYTGGVQNNARMGITPGQGTGNMSTSQIAAQMSLGGGLSSLLPMLGNSMIPQLMFPLFGAMSLVSTTRNLLSMREQLESAPEMQLGINPEEFSYNKAVSAVHQAETERRYFGDNDNLF